MAQSFLIEQIFACGLSWHQYTLSTLHRACIRSHFRLSASNGNPRDLLLTGSEHTWKTNICFLPWLSPLLFKLILSIITLKYPLKLCACLDQYCNQLRHYYSLNYQWSLDVKWCGMVQQCPLLDHQPYCARILDICHETVMMPNYNLLPQSWWGLYFSTPAIRILYVTLN